MVLFFGEPQDKADQLSLNPSFSRLVLVIELGFGIICGVGAELFERHFQNSIALVVTRNLLLQMSCFFLIRGFTRIFNFVELSKIRRWNI